MGMIIDKPIDRSKISSVANEVIKQQKLTYTVTPKQRNYIIEIRDTKLSEKVSDIPKTTETK